MVGKIFNTCIKCQTQRQAALENTGAINSTQLHRIY